MGFWKGEKRVIMQNNTDDQIIRQILTKKYFILEKMGFWKDGKRIKGKIKSFRGFKGKTLRETPGDPGRPRATDFGSRKPLTGRETTGDHGLQLPISDPSIPALG